MKKKFHRDKINVFLANKFLRLIQGTNLHLNTNSNQFIEININRLIDLITKPKKNEHYIISQHNT